MGDVKYQEALAAAEELGEFETEDEVFENLGLRIEDIKNVDGYERVQHYSAEFVQDAEDMLGVEDLKKIGKKWWKKLEPKLMALVCEPGNADLLKLTGGQNIPEMAAGLATAAVVSTLAPPAWLIVATSILATKILSAGLDVLCDAWKKSLEEGGQE
jgi:hypothetical protein